MKELIRVSNVEEPVYLKQGMFGYRTVQPTKNPDGSWNWPNLLFGGYGNLLKLLLILLILFSFIYGVKEMTRSCNDLAETPCKYTNLDCSKYYGQGHYTSPDDIDINIQLDEGRVVNFNE